MLKEPETLRVAIIGSGPAGFFCADYLLRLAKPCSITMFERWPWPFGLVRDAVAPDKPNIRAAANAFTRTALSQGFSFCGNIAIGRDIPLDALQRYYHGIIIASGASAPRPLPIQGASLQGCESAVTFAGWYNGRPDCATLRPNLDCLSAVIIGTGNAAIDVARMLAMPPEALKHTDIPSSALQRLVASKVTDIHIVGRRGPMEVRFAPQELELLARIPGCAIDLPSGIEELKGADADDPSRARLEKAYLRSCGPRSAKRRIHFHFNMTPSAILGTDRVTGVLFDTADNEAVHIPCGLVITSIGQNAEPMPGVPFDPDYNGIPNMQGRVLGANGPLHGLYTAGAIARGANSTIGANKPDCLATVRSMMEDRSQLCEIKLEEEDTLFHALREQGITCVSFQDWQHIDAVERQRGASAGKVRDRFTAVEEALAALDKTEQ